jgi:peptide-methionine (S)-S-oxide reductase
MKKYSYLLLLFGLSFGLASCTAQTGVKSAKKEKMSVQKPEGYSVAYFASGCFWCVEAVFESVEGVKEAVSGYSGGNASDANYSDVSRGITKHAEAVEVFYDASVVNYNTLLKVFFGSQDPTTLNQQGPDRGTQYRSSIFFQNEEEKMAALAYVTELTEKKVFKNPIMTEVVPFEAFYDAEEYHQDYEKKNPNQPYVRAVSIPRLKKFQAKFPELLKKEFH